jgi:hypothetical protein
VEVASLTILTFDFRDGTSWENGGDQSKEKKMGGGGGGGGDIVIHVKGNTFSIAKT